ncbi:MAG: hypothetical protein ACE5JI_15500 [Acidobacteriota bacterium]
MSPTRLVRLLAPSGHWTSLETMQSEMRQAHYQKQKTFDFLPGQSFLIFAPLRP